MLPEAVKGEASDYGEMNIMNRNTYFHRHTQILARKHTPKVKVKVKVKVFIVAYTKFLQRSEILMTWQPTSTQ